MIRYKDAWISECPSCSVDAHSDLGIIERLPGQRIMARVVTELGLELDVCLRWCACPVRDLIGEVKR